VIGPKVGEGREAEVYAWGDDAVVKLYRPGYLGHRAEAVALAALDGHGLAPRLFDAVDRDGRPGLVLERLSGSDMLGLLPRQPWRVLALARALAKAHRAVHEVRAPEDLPDLRQVLAARIQNVALPQPLRAFALRVLDGLPTGDRLCHGDFHPGNVLVAADRVGVIDWANAARGVPEADHARTLLLLRWADPLPGTPLITRGLMAAGRSVFAHQYARTYRGSQNRLPRVDSWLTVHAAARLAEGIEVEQPTLIGRIERARRNATR
jgi:aminoglycoside phosphotransferase (APT) family kinase protein